MNNNIERIESHLTEAGKVLLSTVELSRQIAEAAEVAISSLVWKRWFSC